MPAGLTRVECRPAERLWLPSRALPPEGDDSGHSGFSRAVRPQEGKLRHRWQRSSEGIHWTVELGSPPAPAVGPCGEHGVALGHASAPGGGADRGGRPCCPVGGSLRGQAGAPGGAFRGPPSCPHLSCQGSQPLPWGRSCYETGWGPTGLPEQEGGTEAGGVRPGRALRPRGLGLGLGRGQGPLRGRGVPCGVLGRQASMGRLLSPAPTELRPPQLSGGGSEPNRAEERGASHGLGKEAGGLVSEWEAHVTQVPTPLGPRRDSSSPEPTRLRVCTER